MANQTPAPLVPAWMSVARCAVKAALPLAGRRVHLRRTYVGQLLHFADGSTSTVYRHTVVDRPPATDPAVLLMGFRLRLVRGPGHDLFRPASVFSTPLFVGFPGLISKLWMANDEHGMYRGFYQWDGAEQAEHYARSLWRILALVSASGSICYHVLPGLLRDDLLRNPELAPDHETGAWWRLTAAPALTR